MKSSLQVINVLLILAVSSHVGELYSLVVVVYPMASNLYLSHSAFTRTVEGEGLAGAAWLYGGSKG